MAFPIGAAIGGGLGLLGGLFGGGGVDPYTEAIRRYALRFGRPMMGDAASAYRGALPGIGIGMDVLSGNQDALMRMMGPGQGLLDTIYNRQEGVGLNEMRKQLTLAGGLRNTRSALPIGSFMRDMAGTRAQGTLGLMGQAYGNAGTLLNAGMGAAGGLTGMGQFLLGLGMQGPMQGAGFNPFTSFLGGAAMGHGLFPGGIGANPYTQQYGNMTPSQGR